MIAVHANSFRSVRGRTIVCCIFDEVSFWRDDRSATPDVEVYTAILPSLLAPKGSPPRMLIGISSAYRRVGLLHQMYRDYYGIDEPDILVVKGDTLTFNQSVDEVALAAMRAADPTAHRAEWDSEFRDDISGFLDDAVIDKAVNRHRPPELLPRSGVFYRAYADTSGGASSGDYYTLAIAHKEGEKFIVDVIRGKQGPFDPYALTEEYCALCRQYKIGTIYTDSYAAEWVAQAFRDAGMIHATIDMRASQLFQEAEPVFMRGMIELPPHEVSIREFRLLERRLGNVNESVGHPRGVHDDHANAIAGVVRILGAYRGFVGFGENAHNWIDGPDLDAQPSDTANQTYKELADNGGTTQQILQRWLEKQNG